MGRVVANIRLSTATAVANISALVDTGATFLCVPQSVIQEMGLERGEERPVRFANGDMEKHALYGPVRVALEGFGFVWSSVMALPEGTEPLLGYTILEELGIAVDMAGHRLLRVEADLKRVGCVGDDGAVALSNVMPVRAIFNSRGDS